jgi:peptide/nickel transport system permease protein
MIAFALSRPLFLLGLVIVGVQGVLAGVGPHLAPHDPVLANPARSLQPPDRTFWLGTDENGFDVLSRLLAAPRTDIVIAISATAISLGVGMPLGLFTGYFAGRGGWAGALSETLLRLTDMIQVFPVFIFALGLVAALGPRPANVIAAIAFVNVPVFLRLTRAETLSIRQHEFVEAAVALGNPPWRTAVRHVAPNAIPPTLVQASVTVGWAVLLTAGLSFVGAGVRVPTPEWGSMIAIGARNMVTGQWWPSVFPGLALAVAVMGFALVGDGIRAFLDPRAGR